MRPDMKSVVTDRTKCGGGRSSGTAKAKKITEDSPTREGRSRIGYDNKNNDGLYGPIKRFLQSKIGKKWDDVWSEICKNSKDDTGRVLRERVMYYVTVNCTLDEEGFPVHQGRYRCDDYFVHPTTGILMAVPPRKRTRYPNSSLPNKGKIVEMDGMEYYLHATETEEVWYRVRTADYVRNPEVRHNETVTDVFGSHAANHLSRIYGSNRYIIWKQQANSKEIAKLKELLNGKTS